LRDEYQAFTARDAEILTIGPDNQSAFQRYWESEHLPFVGLPDPRHIVANVYGQEWNLFKLGRVPALLLIDKTGTIRYQHYSASMSDIPENSLLFALLDKMNQAD